MSGFRRTAFVRMWRILVLLRAKPRTLEELSRALGASERTIRRDLQALQRVPLPVESRFPTSPLASRFGVRAALRNEWYVKAMPDAWPDGSHVPVADVQEARG